MRTIYVRDIEQHEWDSWDEFVAQSPQGTFFHTSHYKRCIDSGYGVGTLRLLGAFSETGLVGGCVHLDRTRLRQRTAVTPLLTPYIGFLLGAGPREQATWQHEILATLAQFMCGEYQYQALINSPGLDDLRPLLSLGYTVSPRYTYELNLQLPPEELWLKFDGHVRRHIKKAERLDFEVLENLEAEAAWHLFEQTFARRGQRCPVGREFFEEVLTGAALKEFRQHFCAYRDGKLASFITILCFKDRVYYALAATATDQMQTGVSSYLIWEVLREHAKRDYRVFDFVGANVPSIAKFKAGFNPDVRLHFSVERASGMHVKLGRQLGRLLKK